LYAEDNGGAFPFQGPQGDGVDGGRSASVPAGWTHSVTNQAASADRYAWGNSILPYMQASDLAIEHAPEYRQARWDYNSPAIPPFPIAVTFNGLLTMLPMTGISSPQLVPLVWTGNGRSNGLGVAWSSPTLQCVIRFPCVFDPTEGRHSPSG